MFTVDNEQIETDILIVGCGLSGITLAERFANDMGLKVLIIDQRDHIGGNVYDYIDLKTGIRVSKYGAHLFHTNSDEVWDYINRFDDWVRWDHKVLGNVNDKLVPIPVNINTVNSLCGTNIYTESEMHDWLLNNQVKQSTELKNGEEMAKSRVGEKLYSMIFRDYTFKQWDKYPEELDASVLARIPIRSNFDDRYFNDRYQALPKNGYTHYCENVLMSSPNITVKLNTTYESIKNRIVNLSKIRIFYTGAIDQYFNNLELEKLEYRSIRFENKIIYNCNYFQTASVINYPHISYPFTRIVEHKHFLNQSSPHTIITIEYPCNEGEPYYPVPNEHNRLLYEKYRKLAETIPNVYFVGRLANYKYFNMDEAILNALKIYKCLQTE